MSSINQAVKIEDSAKRFQGGVGVFADPPTSPLSDGEASPGLTGSHSYTPRRGYSANQKRPIPEGLKPSPQITEGHIEDLSQLHRRHSLPHNMYRKERANLPRPRSHSVDLEREIEARAKAEFEKYCEVFLQRMRQYLPPSGSPLSLQIPDQSPPSDANTPGPGPGHSFFSSHLLNSRKGSDGLNSLSHPDPMKKGEGEPPMSQNSSSSSVNFSKPRRRGSLAQRFQTSSASSSNSASTSRSNPPSPSPFFPKAEEQKKFSATYVDSSPKNRKGAAIGMLPSSSSASLSNAKKNPAVGKPLFVLSYVETSPRSDKREKPSSGLSIDPTKGSAVSSAQKPSKFQRFLHWIGRKSPKHPPVSPASTLSNSSSPSGSVHSPSNTTDSSARMKISPVSSNSSSGSTQAADEPFEIYINEDEAMRDAVLKKSLQEIGML